MCLPPNTHEGWRSFVFDKCNIQFLPCTFPSQFLLYCYFPKSTDQTIKNTLRLFGALWPRYHPSTKNPGYGPVEVRISLYVMPL